MQDRLTDLLNSGIGYLSEQALTTCAPMCVYFSNRQEKRQKDFSKDIYTPNEKVIEDDRVESAQFRGSLVGVVQDAACVVGSIAYIAGNHSKLATLALGITGFKIAANLVGLGVRELLISPAPSSREQETA